MKNALKKILKLKILVFSIIFASSAMAVDFSGKRVEWIVPFGEGGGSGKWAQFYAPWLSDALPGKPTVLIKYMPGAGSTKGANYFADRAKPDGLTILGTSGSTQFPYLLNDRRVKYEYKDWHVVLATATGGAAYVSPKLGVKSIEELSKLKGVKLLYGSQGATSLDLVPLLAFEILGLDVQPVFGMKGRSAGRLAFERGETNIDYQTSFAYISKVVPLVKEGKAVPIMSWGALDADGNLVRDPNFPDLPTPADAYKMIHGKAPSGPAWEAWMTFFTAGFPAQKMVFLPKGTSREIIDTYTEAFNKIFNHPDFPAKSKKRLGTYPQLTGAGAALNLKQATTVSDSSKAWVQNWLKDRFGVNLKK
ncbi:MAG: tricarboxylate transporter [SAR324 cluster bacterium]|nr:tricarboxylate transporter [SAR324 cluster bacterium]